MATNTLDLQILDALLEEEPFDNYSADTAADPKFIGLLANINRDVLAKLMHETLYQKGDIICREGESGTSIYLIWSGQVAVLKGDLAQPTLLGYRGPGEVIGEMALLENDVRSASIIAIEPVRMFVIGREDFLEFIQNKPEIQRNLMTALSHRLRQADVDRQRSAQFETQLSQQLNSLQAEKENLLAIQRVRQETSDLIIHDLRNPLNLMYSAVQMLEIMLPEELVAQNRELLDIANGAFVRMERLVESLLDVSRMENNTFELKSNPLNIGEMLKDMALQSKLALEKRHVTTQMMLADDLPVVMGDEEKINRVIANLVDNAIKYMPKNGTLTLSAQPREADVLVCVMDTGPGIPERDRERVFERFAQVEGEIHKRHGFGLGLAFCKLAIEAHDGTIWVEAGDEGIGSRFCFTLPLINEEETDG